MAMPMAIPPSMTQAAPVGGAAPSVVPRADPGTVAIESPMVGTFSTATPNPDSPAFVSVGQAVMSDTVVCMVEAMKVFNEIKAEKSGTWWCSAWSRTECPLSSGRSFSSSSRPKPKKDPTQRLETQRSEPGQAKVPSRCLLSESLCFCVGTLQKFTLWSRDVQACSDRQPRCRSPFASCGPAARWGSRRSVCIQRPTRTRRT